MSNSDIAAASAWRTSSHSGPNGNCVQATGLRHGFVAVRDSKQPQGPVLVLSAGRWRRLLGTITAEASRLAGESAEHS